MNIDETDIMLLKSVHNKRKVLHMGYTPVWAIQRAFELERNGYIRFESDMAVVLTQKGIDLIEDPENKKAGGA